MWLAVADDHDSTLTAALPLFVVDPFARTLCTVTVARAPPPATYDKQAAEDRKQGNLSNPRQNSSETNLALDGNHLQHIHSDLGVSTSNVATNKTSMIRVSVPKPGGQTSSPCSSANVVVSSFATNEEGRAAGNLNSSSMHSSDRCRRRSSPLLHDSSGDGAGTATPGRSCRTGVGDGRFSGFGVKRSDHGDNWGCRRDNEGHAGVLGYGRDDDWDESAFHARVRRGLEGRTGDGSGEDRGGAVPIGDLPRRQQQQRRRSGKEGGRSKAPPPGADVLEVPILWKYLAVYIRSVLRLWLGGRY